LLAPPRYLDRFRSIADEKRRTYAAMISPQDDGVGRLLAKLHAHRFEERTLVVFLSDNGGPIGDRANGSSNQPLRAGKGTTSEGGGLGHIRGWSAQRTLQRCMSSDSHSAITTALAIPATGSFMTMGQGGAARISNAMLSSPPLLPNTKHPG
jgi:hypothetical protein